MEVFNRVLCKENIKLEPRFLDKRFKDEIFSRLKKRVEGICSKHGYIKHDSLEIYKISPGVIELSTLSGNVVYEVYFYADICNPMVGSIINGIVSNVNRFGILANAGYIHEGKQMNVLDIIIAKNSVKVQSDIELNSVKVGDELKIEILGKKLELGEKKISTIGRAIKELVPFDKSQKSCKEIDDNIDEEDDVIDDVPSEINGESDEEESEVEESEGLSEDEELSDEEDVKNGGSDFFSDEGDVFSDEDNFADEAADEDDVASVIDQDFDI